MKGLLHQIPLQERHHLTSQKQFFFLPLNGTHPLRKYNPKTVL